MRLYLALPRGVEALVVLAIMATSFAQTVHASSTAPALQAVPPAAQPIATAAPQQQQPCDVRITGAGGLTLDFALQTDAYQGKPSYRGCRTAESASYRVDMKII